MSLDQRFADAMGQRLGPNFPSDIGLAVSGGGDSMAMLYLAHNWTRVWGVRLWVVTVDHGFRPESADEAAMVAEECRLLGWPHATLRWHWDGTGNKMDAARRARLDLIDQWRGGVGHVLMAHTRDDLAETFLMRLKRGSGVDGLAAMAPRRFVTPSGCSKGTVDGAGPPDDRRSAGFEVIRPCLEITRAEMRHYLRVLKGRWVEDPSNDDPAYDRARLRRLLPLLEKEGLGQEVLAATAERLREEATALRLRTAEVWDAVGAPLLTADGADTGILSLDPDWTRQCDPATQRRLLSAMIRYVSGADYAPRAEALEGLRERMASGGGGTLHGCEVIHHKGRILIFREFAAVAEPTQAAALVWDRRWQISPAIPDGCSVRALGEDGWQQARDRPDGAPPFRAALSLPSVWQGERLLACDGLGLGPGQTVRLCRADGVRGFVLSH
ncbi:tRNA lysidine(34) synthetase TilS [Antarctobacter sp.]|uniref:tRNA lysidine(34) synthetase TilS n=1 Tax=Antarctobacter sp. TaxID=1872577 RepID=UPI002B2709B5|nr:tRNA lysidine(34) synthetase TilS [Antarctobacter sp.]